MINEFDGRLRVLGIVVILIIFALIIRAGYLQVYNGEYYSRLADGNRIRVIPYTAPRGLFTTVTGKALFQTGLVLRSVFCRLILRSVMM